MNRGGGNYSQSENNVEGGSSDGTGEPSETSAPAETSVTEPPADTEVTTATGETSAETTAPAEDTYGDTSNADETGMNTQETSETDETEETEQDEIDLLELEQHIHDDIVFEPLNSENIYSGSYYLAADNVKISDIDGKVDLCLNGKSIKHSGFFYIEANTVLNIYDDYAPGENVQIYIDGIYMGLGGANQTINIHGGYVNLSSDVDSNNPCTINVYDGKFDSDYSIGPGTLNIYGGEIDFPNLDISDHDGTLTLSGNPKMDGTTITTKTDNPIKITGQLGADVKCKVQLGEYGKYDGTGLFAELSDESYASESNFISPEGYTVVKVGTKLYLTDHLHEDGTAFFPWTETDSLPTESGSYYLTDDVNSAYGYSYLEVKDTTINLCLNGHNISRVHLENATLNIYDETGAGKISGILCQGGGSVLNIYGGTLEDSGISLNLQNRTNNPNVVHIYGGTINSGEVSAINIEGSSDKVEISGGTINCGTKNGGINVNKGTLTISGEPTISGNFSGVYGAVCFGNDNSFYLSGSPTINGKNGLQAFRAMGRIININGKLTPKEPITIALPPEPEEETYLFAVMEDESYADASAFEAYDEGYTIVKNGKKLYLTKQQETHEHDGKVFTPWLDTESLPTESGNYYLTKDVVINVEEYHISSDISLCLNGYSISFDERFSHNYQQTWLFVDGSNFNLYDESGGQIKGDCYLQNINNGNMTIYGGILSECRLGVMPSGNVTIKGGTFPKGCEIRGGNLTIDGGTIGGDECTIGISISSGILVVNGGDITGNNYGISDQSLGGMNEVIINGGNICGKINKGIMLTEGKLTVTGGTIKTNNGGYDVGGAISVTNVTFELSGNAEIDGEIRVAKGCPINIVGELTNTEPYEIYMTTPGVFATGDYAAQSADKFKCERLSNEGYTVVVTEGNELAIDYPHYTYGDTIVLSARGHKPPPPEKDEESVRPGTSTISLPVMLSDSDSVTLTVNGQQAKANNISVSVDGRYTFSVTISRENGFVIGENEENEIKGTITGTDGQYGTTLWFTETNVGGNSDTVKVIVEPKTISAEFADSPAKTYDGTTDCEAKFTSDGILKGDDVFITAKRCEFDSADVGTREVTAYGLTITGDQSDFYKLEEDEIIGSGEITPKPLDIPESEFTYDGETVRKVEIDGENGEKVTATLTAYSKNAGTYTYNINAADGFYTAELSSTNYSIDKAGALTIDPRVAEIEWQDETTFVYDGEAKIVKAALSNKVANDDVEFEFKGNVGTKAGTYTAGVIGFIGADEGNYTLENAENTEQSWKITAADSSLTLTAENKTVTYGGNVSLTATVKRTSTNGIMTMSAAPDNVDFYIGDDLIGTASVTYTDGSNGTAVLELPATSAKHFKAGENTIRAEYGGSGDLLASSGEIVIKVEPKPVTADIVGVTSKAYDGTNVITNLSLRLDGIESCDAENVEAAAESYTFNSANVNEASTITANGAALFGTQAENYKLTVNTAQGEITPAKVDIPEGEFTYDGETVRKVEIDGVNGEKVTATLTAYSKNAGTYTYDVTASAGKYTAELSSTNYSIDTAGALTIDPRVAEIEWQDEISFDYDGEAKIVKATLSNKVANDDVEFEFKGNVGTKAGTYTAGVIGFIGADKGNYTLENAENTEQSWKITAADSSLTLTAESKTVTYGGNISLTATVKRTSTNGIMTMSAELDNVDFYIGDDLIGTASVTYTDGSNGTAVLELPATSAKHFKAGENTIRAEYGGSGDLLVSSGEIVIKVEPKPVTADIVGVTSKAYDGTNVITNLSLRLDGIESCDAENVEATAESYTFNSADVETANTITANGAELFGTQAENYKLTVSTAQGEITPAKVDVPESEFTYDGETVREIELDGENGEKVTATLTAYSKNAGTYTYNINAADGFYTAELSSTNYSIDTAGALTIDPRVAEIEWQDEISFDYDGTEKSVAAEVTNTVSGDALNIVYKNNKAADVGEYTAEITSLGDDNYTLDGAENVTLAWEISAVGREETNVAIDYIGETLSTSNDMEYSTDGETWLPCAENMSVKAVGWNESESLTVKFRYAADKNHTAGKTQNVTIPPRPAAPDISEVTVTKTQDSITVTEIANCEYSIDGTTWQDSGTFEGLTEGTEYTVQIRTKADESKFASFAAEKTVVTSDTSSGTTDLKEGETVETDSGSITNDGKNVEIEDNDGNKTTVTLPDGASDSVEVDESGNVQVPDGSVVETGDTTLTLPDGGTVSPDGTITADKVVIGDTTVSGDEVTVTPDGNITVSENGTVQSGDTTVELPDGGTVSPDGTITADKVVIGDTTVSGDEVTVTPDGDITVSENGTVQSGDTTVELPDGGTVSPDGTITADKVVIGDTTVSGDEVTVTPDGNITVSENGTVQSGDTTVELPDGGTVSPDGTITADKVVIGDTTFSGDEVTVTPDGNITVSENGTVQSGDTTVELPDGGTISPDGTITADKVVIGDTTVSGDEVTVTPDGNITVSENGTIQNGDTTVTLPDGGTVSPDGTITADKVVIGDTTVSGDEVTVTPDGNITVSGNGEVQDEDTIVTGETVTVDKDGNIAIPNGGTVSANGSETVIGNDGSINNNEVSIEPVDSMGYCDENGDNYSLDNGYIVLDIESADDDEIVKDLESESDISVIKAYDIKLLYNGKFEVQPNGTVKVTIAAPTGVDGTEKVLHINENGFEDMNAEYDRNSNTFSFKTDHFSIYVIAASDDDPIVPPPTSSGSTQTPPIEPEPEETTSPEETTGPEETTAPEETTSSEETTVPEETAKPEETTDYPTDVAGDNSENNPPTGVSPDLAVLATAAFTVAAVLFLKKKRSSDK